MKSEEKNCCQKRTGIVSRRDALKLGGTLLASALLPRSLLAADGTSVTTFPDSGAEAVGRPLYLNPSEPLEKRTQDLISRLTLDEKAMVLDHIGPDVKRLGIWADQHNQCLHGVQWSRPTTMFPVSIAMAATWNPALIREVATAISDEARAIYNLWHQQPDVKVEHKGLIYRAPVINMTRNPYWGRNNECFGEDPFLTGRIGVAYVQGVQGDDSKYLKLVATLKHYAAYNIETHRHSNSAKVSDRMLYEYYLPHFRDCIVEGQAQSVMASYNAINGVPNVINHKLLTEILKNQWKFEGFVVSDMGGIGAMINGFTNGKMKDKVAVADALNAGCDFDDDDYWKQIPAAIRDGLLSEARLNDALYRLLHNRLRLGEFDPPEMVPYNKISPDVIGSSIHRTLALALAQESMVLLKNHKNFLPLEKSKLKRIAVIGPHADMFTPGGYSGRADHPVNPLQGIKNRVMPATEILYAKGCGIGGEHRFQQGNANTMPAIATNEDTFIKEAANIAQRADVAIVYVGTTEGIETEGRDRTSLGLPGRQEDLIKAVYTANPKIIVVLLNAGPLTIPWVKQHVPAIVEAWWNGVEGGNAIADIIFGNYNPAGRLPYTVYASESQVPPQDEYDITKGFTYMYLHGKPLFGFGHGLSYTTFKYSHIKLSSRRINSDGQITVSVKVANTGKREGDEVVQFYVRELHPSVKRPDKELREFRRIHLKAGETQDVAITIPAAKLAYYDEDQQRFRVNPGTFQVMVGASSNDIRTKTAFEVI
ncbi:MAG TPA: glycoside hydrolase family 3 C-terminal domain-containing protein [Verrucomicrobiae bacterium]|nr:glycoside hydrolase family 3 C-terminal domain-containing protein [Verrucomicrobiae bacterium]